MAMSPGAPPDPAQVPTAIFAIRQGTKGLPARDRCPAAGGLSCDHAAAIFAI